MSNQDSDKRQEAAPAQGDTAPWDMIAKIRHCAAAAPLPLTPDPISPDRYMRDGNGHTNLRADPPELMAYVRAAVILAPALADALEAALRDLAAHRQGWEDCAELRRGWQGRAMVAEADRDAARAEVARLRAETALWTEIAQVRAGLPQPRPQGALEARVNVDSALAKVNSIGRWDRSTYRAALIALAANVIEAIELASADKKEEETTW